MLISACFAFAASSCTPSLPETNLQYLLSPSQLAPVVNEPHNDILEYHNGRVNHASPLWSWCDFNLEWTEDGKRYVLRGDGHVMLRLPDRAVLFAYKHGKELARIGSDTDRQWVVDRVTPSAEIIYSNRTSPVDPEIAQFASLLQELPLVLGLSEIESPRDSEWVIRRDLYRETVTFCLARDGYERRVHIHRDSMLPLRVEVLDDEGNMLLISSLTQYAPMERADPTQPTPLVPRRVTLESPLWDFVLEVTADVPQDRTGLGNDIKDSVFSFDAAIKSVGVQEQDIAKYD